ETAKVASSESLSLDVRKLLQRQHQGVRSFSAPALGLHGQVELMGQCQAGQRQLHPLGFFQRDSHVLDEVLYEKTRLEIAVDDSWPQIVERPACCRSAADRLQDRFQI